MSREEKYEEGLRRASLAIWKKDEVSDFVSTPRDLHEYNKFVVLIQKLIIRLNIKYRYHQVNHTCCLYTNLVFINK